MAVYLDKNFVPVMVTCYEHLRVSDLDLCLENHLRVSEGISVGLILEKRLVKELRKLDGILLGRNEGAFDGKKFGFLLES